ncbi:cytoplasmic tRNA 2-thiolation protein 2 [[Candida] railenensis]|uniref:Cytoplasmic tRNA 2-thiolation protein 2 n=1 Tax=[Candida] railenensis TaxID=45579 RepID=A0A9P0W0P8_9ASCO|nr:cytoplasmic tRNA 2-thiolation protein 2 [[Candida] railenensis]
MGSPIEYLDGSDSRLCSRCATEKGVLITRKEVFCKACFIRFIRGKQRKQMQDEKYKVKYGKAKELAALNPTKILLALSMGISSLVLFDVIASLLQEQMEMHKGNTGFELVVLNIDEYELTSLNNSIQAVIPKLKSFFSYVDISFKVLNINSYILDETLIKRIRLYPDFHATMTDSDKNVSSGLKDLLLSCPNKSSAEDLLTIVFDELILRTAYVENCSTVVYGHNMTRIANEIIALTVKGRGSSIHEKVLDHVVHYQDKSIQIVYPLKDVLRAEVEAYCNLIGLSDLKLESTKPKATINRNMTIRDLTTNYFNQLDATGYASTASSVVKTGEKLGPPKNFESSGSQSITQCQVCGIDIHQNPQNWLKRITVNESAPLVTEEDEEYLKLYNESKSAMASLGETEESEAITNPLGICYGCIVTLSSIKAEDGFLWPIRNSAQEKEDILNEYILTEDEEE